MKFLKTSAAFALALAAATPAMAQNKTSKPVFHATNHTVAGFKVFFSSAANVCNDPWQEVDSSQYNAGQQFATQLNGIKPNTILKTDQQRRIVESLEKGVKLFPAGITYFLETLPDKFRYTIKVGDTPQEAGTNFPFGIAMAAYLPDEKVLSFITRSPERNEYLPSLQITLNMVHELAHYLDRLDFLPYKLKIDQEILDKAYKEDINALKKRQQFKLVQDIILSAKSGSRIIYALPRKIASNSKEESYAKGEARAEIVTHLLDKKSNKDIAKFLPRTTRETRKWLTAFDRLGTEWFYYDVENGVVVPTELAATMAKYNSTIKAPKHAR